MNISCVQDIDDPVLEEICQATLRDDEAQILFDTIKHGWPNSINELPKEIKMFYTTRDTFD